jgi:hypothetical protein
MLLQARFGAWTLLGHFKGIESQTSILKNSDKLEVARQSTNHKSPQTTKLYNRRHGEISLDEIEWIGI